MPVAFRLSLNRRATFNVHPLRQKRSIVLHHSQSNANLLLLPTSTLPHFHYPPITTSSHGPHQYHRSSIAINTHDQSRHLHTPINTPATQLLRHALLRAAKNGTAPQYTFNNTHNFSPQSDNVNIDYDTTPHRRSATDRLLMTLAHALDSLNTTSHAPVPFHLSDITLSPDHHQVLRDSGYGPADLSKWLSILTLTRTIDAAHLFSASDGLSVVQLKLASTTPADPPTFIYPHFLARSHISPDAVHVLVDYLPAWYALCRQRYSRHFNFNTAIRSSFKLLAHARRALPHAIPRIVTAFLHLLHQLRFESHQDHHSVKYQERVAVLTALLNRALALVALPCHLEPFKSIGYQESAQADILRFMAEHDPPLIITRVGYRGVARIQLAQRKTPDETAWARLKSPSWPPWKEDRTGMDALIDIEHGVSRARRVVDRSQEAGYPKQAWEAAALILSGWDTDGSPTIQTRSFMNNPNASGHDPFVWISRIRSTRTVHQAWACFLSYEDANLPLNQEIYLAMFEKIAMEDKRLHLTGHARLHHLADDPHHQDPLYPGDVKEVFSPPASAHQATYTRTPLLTLKQLHTHMIDHGMAPAGRTLAFLLTHAATLEEGMHFLESAGAEYQERLVPLLRDLRARASLDSSDLSFIPNHVFAALIGLLGRFPHTMLKRQRQGKSWYRGSRLNYRRPLSVALYLLKSERRLFLPAWTALIRSHARYHGPSLLAKWEFASANVWEGNENSLADDDRRALVKLVAFRHLKHLVSWVDKLDMSLDAKTFRYACIIVEHAAVAATQMVNKYRPISLGIAEPMPLVPTAAEDRKAYFQLYESALRMRGESAWLRGQFWAFVGKDCRPKRDQESTFPQPELLLIPSFAVVHSYIRALGHLRDYEGLHEVTCWMRAYWEQLSTRLEIDRNGSVSFRRCLVALRVFLEGAFEEEDSERAEEREVEAREEMLRSVVEIVESQAWHGWPRDDEVDEYVLWNS